VGENRAFASAPKFSGIILDFIKKVMLIFGVSETLNKLLTTCIAN